MFRLIKDLFWVYRYQVFATEKIIHTLKNARKDPEKYKEKAVIIYKLLMTQSGMVKLFANLANPWRYHISFKYKVERRETYLESTLGNHIVLLRVSWWIEDNEELLNEIRNHPSVTHVIPVDEPLVASTDSGALAFYNGAKAVWVNDMNDHTKYHRFGNIEELKKWFLYGFNEGVKV